MSALRVVLRKVFLFVAGFGVCAAGALGQTATGTGGQVRAARLTFLQGTVTVDSADNTGSQAAELNLPLLAGVRLATGEDGQAEVEFEDGSLVRLTPNTALSLDTLSVDTASGVFTTGLSLLHGLAYVELRATAQYRYTVDVGGDVLAPVENTTVRVDYDEPPAVFAVLDGTARVARAGGGYGSGYGREVRAGEGLRGDAVNPGNYTLTTEIAADSWDNWNEERDQAAMTEAASRTAARDNYAGAQGYGWADLDANGSWYDVPGQGEVWQPAVASVDAGFDPYANGSWVWYPGTGYVWASGYGWGWTPYRCGSWSYYNGFGWGWLPASGCGGYGWGFYGGGRPVNIVYVPAGYRVPHVPIAQPGGSGRPHPGPVLPPVQPGTAAQPSLALAFVGGGTTTGGERRIGGVMVRPLEPVGSGYTLRGGTAVGSALMRDFPMDKASRTPVVGQVSTQPPPVLSEGAWIPAPRPAGGRQGTPAITGSAAYRENRGAAPVRPSAVVNQGQRTVPTQPAQRPSYTPAPVQRSAPAPAPVPRSAPAPAPSPAPARPSPK
jgi:hypothetical protein